MRIAWLTLLLCACGAAPGAPDDETNTPAPPCVKRAGTADVTLQLTGDVGDHAYGIDFTIEVLQCGKTVDRVVTHRWRTPITVPAGDVMLRTADGSWSWSTGGTGGEQLGDCQGKVTLRTQAGQKTRAQLPITCETFGYD